MKVLGKVWKSEEELLIIFLLTYQNKEWISNSVYIYRKSNKRINLLRVFKYHTSIKLKRKRNKDELFRKSTWEKTVTIEDKLIIGLIQQ